MFVGRPPFRRRGSGYPCATIGANAPRLAFAPLRLAMGRDMAAGVDAEIVAARLRAGFGDALMTLLDACDALAAHRLILSGGVMQNRILRHGLRERLWAKGIEPARLI